MSVVIYKLSKLYPTVDENLCGSSLIQPSKIINNNNTQLHAEPPDFYVCSNRRELFLTPCILIMLVEIN